MSFLFLSFFFWLQAIIVRPYKSRLENALEIFNETVTLIFAFAFMLMTDVTDNWELEYNLGYIIIFLEVIIIVTNISFILMKFGASIWRKMKSFRFKKQKVRTYSLDPQSRVLTNIDDVSQRTHTSIDTAMKNRTSSQKYSKHL